MPSLLSCPEEEEEYTSESEEEKRAAEARVQKIHKLQGTWKLVTSSDTLHAYLNTF